MPSILSVESSTKVCSVALAVDGKVVFNKENKETISHASLLGVYVAEAVDFARSKQLRIQAVAVSSGPGSYTGLRIGASEAKGLCYGWDVPLIAVPSLMVMAKAFSYMKIETDYYCPMIDARRMEVYAAVYDKQFRLVRDVSAEIINEGSFQSFLSQGKVLFFGDGAEKCRQIIQSANAVFISDIVPLASYMASLAEDAFQSGKFEDAAYFEPFYLKEFVATVPKNKVININQQ